MTHRRAARSRTVTTLGLWLLTTFLVPCVGRAADQKDENSIKAAFVYKFTRYISWPKDALAGDGDLRVTVFGDEDMADEFAKLDGAVVGEHTVRLTAADDPQAARGAHVVFVARSEREQWPRIQAAISGEPALLIGEMNGFLESGGIINLNIKNQRIQFEVNLLEAQERQLSIGSRILKLASHVIMEKEKR